MEQLQLDKLYEIIKNDDAKSFSFFMRKFNCKDIAFGRFPILSLCYLYGSKKIIKASEKDLRQITEFTIVNEDYHMYLDFKSYAKKSLKLYPEDSIIYPLEMLAIIDNRDKLRKEWNCSFLNEKIINNITKIYKISQQETIKSTKEKVEIRKKPLSRKLKILSATTTIILTVLIFLLSTNILIISKTKGLGTQSSPIKICSEYELFASMKNNSRHYVLTEDISIESNHIPQSFNGTLDGNGHTIKFKTNTTSPLLDTLLGEIKNITIDKPYTGYIDHNYSIICNTNNGKIINTNIIGETIITAQNLSNDTTHISPITTNYGLIENCSAQLPSTIANEQNTDLFLSGICGINYGDIVNCSNDSDSYTLSTTDSAGITIDNYGTINKTLNKTKIKQSTNNEWNPNCAGICINNYGTISNSINENSISTESLLESSTNNISTLIGGISCNNYGEISNSINKGNLSTTSKFAKVYIGGVVCWNIGGDENNSILSNCKSACDITASCPTNEVYIGGICSYNYPKITTDEYGLYSYIETHPTIDRCGYEGVISYNSKITVAGGLIGYNYYGVATNSYSLGRFVCSFEGEEKLHLIGGISGISTTEKPSYMSNNYYLYDDGISCPGYYSFFNQYIQFNDTNMGASCCFTKENIPSEVLGL